jgi:type III secretory pathway component EscR
MFKFKKGVLIMSQLNQVELQNLRHLIGAHDTACQKMQTYAQQASDPQVKAFFEKSAQDAQQTKQQLISFLN